MTFVVLKFGGTSVATRDRWHSILVEAKKRAEEGHIPVVVCSAVTKMTDALQKLVNEAVEGRHAPQLTLIRDRHQELATALGVDLEATIGEELKEIERLAVGASLLREKSARLFARTMAMGEILSTKLGAAFMTANGLNTEWIDARTCFVSTDPEHRPESQRLLNATVSDDKDPQLAQRFEAVAQAGARCIITQGFIACDAGGGTVLLGRGGSDTSASYFAAKLSAVRCEIWTDVPGIFSADPRVIPSAVLVKASSFGEAQEIASMGAKVLHPRSIMPCRRHRVPMEIRWTDRPDMEGTRIVGSERSGEGHVKAICHKRGVTLVVMETSGMWQQVGFLADVFAVFKEHGLSVDLVSTSEMNVTASLDGSANTIDQRVLEALTRDLSRLCRVKIVPDCATVALVGRRIRAILHELGPVLSVFQEQKIHLVSQAASDLNLTFVVDEEQAERLVRELHALLFTGRKLPEAIFGPAWRSLFDEQQVGEPKHAHVPSWWRDKKDELLKLAHAHSPLYVMDPGTLDESVNALRGMKAIDRALYAMKANSTPAVLQHLHKKGVGFECVSLGEIDAVRAACPNVKPQDILFTPNFAPKDEVKAALALGVQLTIDNAALFEKWDDLLAGQRVFLRVDPGVGRGHHHYVKTGGASSKFGVSEADLQKVSEQARKIGCTITGLHAHAGSGILEPSHWADVALFLVDQARKLFPDAKVLDLGGGLGVPEKPGQGPLDLSDVDEALMKVKQANPGFQIWMEPGRFLVARAGALLAKVTQVKHKGALTYVGVDTGMNALIRPALYGAYHEIVNLSRLDDKTTMTATVVGPICESADVLGYARKLAPAREGDVLLVGTTGAYGRAMSSNYNLRPPPDERLL